MRLTEAQLQGVIKNTVNQILRENMEGEGMFDFFRGAAKKVGNDVQQGAQQMYNNTKGKVGDAYNNVKQGVQNTYNKAKQGVQNTYNNVKQYAQDVQAAGQQASNQSDAQNAINVIQNLMQKGILKPNIGNMVIGNLRKYGNQ